MTTTKAGKKTGAPAVNGQERVTAIEKADPLKMHPTIDSLVKTTQDLLIFSQYAADSNLFPKLRDKFKAFIVGAKGHELGIHPVSSFQVIHPIETKEGVKIAVEAKLYGAIAMDNGVRWKIHKKDPTGCKLEIYSIRDKTIPNHVETFTIEDAKRAGLTNKNNWIWYPEEMCYNRCLLKGMRVFDPRICMGMYSVEEVLDFEPIESYETKEDPEKEKDLVPETKEAPRQTAAEAHPQETGRTTEDIKKSEQLGMGEEDEEEVVEGEIYDDAEPEELEGHGAKIGEPVPTDPMVLKYKEKILDYLHVQGMDDFYQPLKEWLSVFQTSRDPMRRFVDRNQFGYWSIEKGKKEDLKILTDNLIWTMNRFIDEHCFKKLGLPKAGVHTNPAFAKEKD